METIQTESSWAECLSEGHIQFILEYVQQAQSREAAVIDQFLKERLVRIPVSIRSLSGLDSQVQSGRRTKMTFEESRPYLKK